MPCATAVVGRSAIARRIRQSGSFIPLMEPYTAAPRITTFNQRPDGSL